MIKRICRTLEGLPLAIELAAARVRILTLQQIAEGLDNCLRLLASSAPGVPDRHRTLEATLDFSHDVLPPEEAAVFRRLSVFPAGSSLQAAEAVAGGGLDVLEPLSRLVERSLMQAVHVGQTVRYRLPESVRQYAAARLDDSGEKPQVWQRQVQWCLALVTGDSVPGSAAWAHRIDEELGNLAHGLLWACEHDPLHAVRLAGALWPFHRHNGRYAEARSWTERALRSSSQSVPVGADLARALHGAGVMAFLMCDYDEAIERLDAALAAYPPGDHEAGEVLRTLAGIWRERGDYGRATDLLQRVREEASRRFDDPAVCRADLSIAMTAWLACRPDEASSTAQQALRSSRLDDVETVADAHLLIALSDLAAGRVATARSLLEPVLETATQRGAQESVAYALHGLGQAALAESDTSTARAHLTRSLAVHARLGDRWRTSSVLDDLARCALSLGDAMSAARLLGAADDARETIGVPVPALERASRARLLAAVETDLGADQLAAGRAAGRAVGYDSMVHGVLDPVPPGNPERGVVHVRDRSSLLDVRALGGSLVQLDGQPVEGGDWGYAKPRELLHLLLIAARSKDAIGRALWPDADAAGLRSAFHTCLNRLRRAIGSERIVFGGGLYAMSPALPTRYDVATFGAAVAAAARAPDDAGRAQHLRAAAQAYAGGYLASEPVAQWALAVRADLQREAEQVLLELGGLLLVHDAGTAAGYFERALTLDPLLEAAHRGLMRSHVRLGEPARALRQYANLRTALREELDVEPAPSTVQLASKIRALVQDS